MSSFYNDQVKCPKCGHTPITALDSGSYYLYICGECFFETRDYEVLVKIDDAAGRQDPASEENTVSEEKSARPDVERIRERAGFIGPPSFLSDARLVCDYALDLEKERNALMAKLNQNKCNSGHTTLPLALWDCPECVRINREALEVKLKAAEDETEAFNTAYVKARDQTKRVNELRSTERSLLTKLVEAVELHYDVAEYDDDFAAVFTAAKRYLAEGGEDKETPPAGS